MLGDDTLATLLPFPSTKEGVVRLAESLVLPVAAVAPRMPAAHVDRVPASYPSVHATSLSKVSDDEFLAVQGAYLSTYEVKDVFPAAMLMPKAVSVLPTVTAATVFDEAVRRGLTPLGIAPANSRRGKYNHPIVGNPPRVFAGPAKLPHQAATVFSCP